MAKYLFCYGSNHPGQLADRLERTFDFSELIGAYAPGYLRAFRGWSQRWEGGVATLIKGKGATYGYVASVTASDLRKLDVYEGIASGNYVKTSIPVVLATGEEVTAIAYLATSREKNPPSRSYLEAIVKTIAPFWDGASGPVKVKDIAIRNRSRRNPLYLITPKSPACERDKYKYFTPFKSIHPWNFGLTQEDGRTKYALTLSNEGKIWTFQGEIKPNGRLTVTLGRGRVSGAGGGGPVFRLPEIGAHGQADSQDPYGWREACESLQTFIDRADREIVGSDIEYIARVGS